MHYLTRSPWLMGLFLLLTPFFSGAQNHNHSWGCGSDLILERVQKNPDWLKKHLESEQEIYDFFASKSKPLAGKRMMTVTLPVVVHLIHDNGPENISDARVLNGIQQLNEAFANIAYYDQGTGTNTMIQFCLAQRTPDDQATNGITRNQHPLTNLTLENDDIALKDLNRWTPTDYINIWLVREICSSGSGCGVAGYAYLPASHGNPEDGIVMEAEYLGATPGGTGVLVHEMGHYLGLYHTFEGGCSNDDCLADGDRVCDTPPDQSTLWTACNSVINTCTTDAQSGFSSDQPDMILNFMDYTDFDCFNDFTPDQSDRMNWHIDNVRFSLLDSRGCLTPCPNPITAVFTASAVSVNVGQIVNFTNGSANAASYTWTINGVPFSSTTNASYTFTIAGTFVISLTANSGNSALCNSESFERIVQVTCPVVADFDVSTLTPALGEAVTVTNQSQNATQYEWFLEGVSQGTTFNGFTPDATGVYVIRLMAGNGFCQQTKLKYLSVQDSCANTSFQKTWGSNNGDDRGNQTITLSDGNFLVAGTTVVSGETDIYLLKTGTDGTAIWQKRFGLAGIEQVGKLLALSDGGWIITGNTTAAPGNTHPFLARFSANGTVVWQKKISTPAAVNIFTGAIRLQDGNLLVSGAINNANAIGYTGYLAKMTLDGTVLWSNIYDGGSTDWISGLLELPNGDLIAAGFTLSFGQNTSSIHDGMVMRLTSTGTLIWVNAYGSVENEGFSSIFLAPDGNLVTLGATSGWNGPGGGQYMDDSWMVKLSPDGGLIWSKVYRSNLDVDLSSRDVHQASDDGYVIAANDLGTNGTGFNSLFFKTGPEGELEWSRMYAATGENRLTSVDAAPDGYIFTGYVDNGGNDDLWFLRTDEAGLAGICPELPHQINVFPAQPIVASGLLNTLPAPAMITSTLTLNDLVLEEEALCSPVCLEYSDCENTWIKTVGANGLVEGGTNIIRAVDGNFYLSGYREDSTLLMKMTPGGLLLWTRSFKFTSGTEEVISQLIEDSDGNLVGCGFFTSNQFNGFIFKYNPSSDQVIWAHQNPAAPQTLYYAILEMSLGGNYLAFNSYHNSPAPGSSDDADMVEINRNTGLYTGIKRAFTFGSSEGVIEAQRRNNRIYTAGRYTYGNNLPGMRGGVSCFDLSGNEIWSRMPLFGASEQARNYATDFVFDGDNMVTIYYGDFNGSDAFTEQFAVSKSDLNGNINWARLYTLDGFPEVYVKSIVTVPDGYVILATNVKIDQPASVFLIKIDKNGAVLWARDYRDMLVLQGEKFLVTVNDYLYFIASYGTGDIALAKVRLSDGLVGNGCESPLDLVVTGWDLPPVFNPINLIDYPAPITQALRVAIPHVRNLTLTDLCVATCATEICNNGLDDDGDGLFDCLDPECDCSGCDGEQTRFWYFGDGGGLDFATDPPTVLNNGQTFSREASSVATDMMGNLLFYTDASSLYDRNHNLMPNGNNLDGHSSTTQTLILPQPGSPWLFWVFTPNSFDNLATGKGLSYSVVDMSLNGSLGDVVPSQKNIQLLPQNQFTEKITATRHCNGTDWWVLVKERNNNNFRAYLLTAAGLGAPVISSVGTAGTVASPNVIGTLKFNASGNKVVNVLFHTNSFELFDFDKSTGFLSNPVSVADPVMLEGSYAVEFSADGKLLYLTKLRPPSQIWQFNLNVGDAATILQSGVEIAAFPDEYRFGQLQRAQNGKIYVTNTFPLQFTTSLGIIHQPEIPGTGCLYQQSGLAIAPGGANLGLPSFPQDFLPKRLFLDILGPDSLCSLPGSLSFSLDITDRCVLDSVRWTLIGPGNIASQSDEGIEINFTQAGTATLIARAFSACSDGVDTLRIHVFENNTPVLDLGPDLQTCENGVEILDAGPGFQQYRWNDGSTEPTLTTLFPGAYWVDVWDACGNHQSDTVNIAVLPATILNLGADRTICSNATLTYTLPPAFASWVWSPATGLDCSNCNTVTISAGDTITYIVLASTGENCLSADTLTIFYANDTVFASLDTVVCSNETLLLLGLELPADTVVLFYGVSAGGCDSVLTVTVTGIDPVQTLVQESSCPGDTLQINGISITRDTSFQFLLTGVNGCDSLVVVEVELLEPPARAVTLQVCPGAVAMYGGVEIPPGTTRVVFVPGIAGSCDSVITVTATLLPPPVLQLPATDTLEAGNAIQLTPFVFGNGPFGWQWAPVTPLDWLSCYDCPNPMASPLTTTLFSVTVTDANGCEAMDSIALVVLPCKEPYIPNVFSPNGDGINDWFYLQSSECVIHLRYLRIFDRWGELVFQRNDFSPNVAPLGWDGRFRGKMMTSNVFVWVVEIEFPDGTVLLKKGDVTLLR